MKKKIILAVFFLIGIVGCTNNEMPEILNNHNDSDQIELRFSIYRSCWKEWGRKSKDCKGWGLCDYQDAWFWEDDFNDVCPMVGPGGSGTIEYDESLLGYFMTIELDSNDPVENEAIFNQSPLFVDEDIIKGNPFNGWNSIKIPSGEYSFNINIGNSGGYKIPVIKN